MPDVRLAVYQCILETGRVPLAAQVADRLAIAVEDVRTEFRRLQNIHAFALAPASDEILMAHPFSAVPTAYVVRIDGRAFWANCAWDALAIPAMLGADASVDARCADCRYRMLFTFNAGTLTASAAVIHFVVPPRHFWDNVVFTWATIHAFRSEAHVDRWCEAANIPRGYAMTPMQCWELGRRWYADRLRPDWQPRRPETMRRIFADVGLHGDFWRV